MYAADINALKVHGESAVSQAPASPQASIQTAEPDTPVASYMHMLENSGPPSPLQIGRFGDSPATQRYKRWYWRQSSMPFADSDFQQVSSDEEVLVHPPSDPSSPAVGVAVSDDMPEGTCGKAFSEALRSRVQDVPVSFWPTRAGPIPLFERGPKRRRVEPEIITRCSASWNSGVASWDEPDAVFLGSPSDRAQSSRPNGRLNLDKITKWGRCPTCQHCLRPHLLRSGGRKGQLILYCSRWWQKGSINGRQCWGSRPFDLTRLQELDLRLRQEYNSVENGLCRNAR